MCKVGKVLTALRMSDRYDPLLADGLVHVADIELDEEWAADAMMDTMGFTVDITTEGV